MKSCEQKNSFISWLLLICISLILWYRNIFYDRVISAFLFIFSLIKLVEYIFLNNANPESSARTIYVLLWLSVFFVLMTFLIYLYNNNRINGCYSIIVGIVISLMIIILFHIIQYFYKLSNDCTDSMFLEKSKYGLTSWNRYNDKDQKISFLGSWKNIFILIILFISISILILNLHDIKNLIIFIYILFLLLNLYLNLNKEYIQSLTITLSVGVGFLMYILNIA